jgi:DNA polymerase-1
MAKIITIDGNNWLNRAYYARLPKDIFAKNKNAVEGFIGMFNKIVRESKSKDKLYITVAFDCRTEETFRYKIQKEWVTSNYERAQSIGLVAEGKSSDYKGGRKIYKSEDEREKKQAIKADINRQQKSLIKKLKKAGVLILTGAPWEADDYIGSVANLPFDVEIYSRDKDFAQLVSETTTLIMPEQANSPEIYINDKFDCFEHFGIYPHQVIDYLMLCGDTVDNIPGIQGVGPGTAKKLLTEFDTLSKLKKKKHLLKGNSKAVKLLRGDMKGMPPFSLTRKLARIRLDVPVPKNLKDYYYSGKAL